MKCCKKTKKGKVSNGDLIYAYIVNRAYLSNCYHLNLTLGVESSFQCVLVCGRRAYYGLKIISSKFRRLPNSSKIFPGILQNREKENWENKFQKVALEH